MSSSDTLSVAFAALADPTRRAVLQRLARSEAGVVELADMVHLSQPAMTKHLKVLEHAGFVERRREGQRRPARLLPAGLAPIETWLQLARSEWTDRLDRLEVHLLTQTPPTNTKDTPHA